jgi:DNA-directed RNA polymerase specialized sigma24 family protein
MLTRSIALSPGFELVKPRAVSYSKADLTQQALDRLLAWLHTDREEAGRTYELIRRKLIKVFASRGCDRPEELTDETIDRVMGKVHQIAGDYEGDPALYFYGVARNVWREYSKVKRTRIAPLLSDSSGSPGPELDCLEECMEKLLAKNRDLLVEYYQEDKQAKIDHRRELAGRHGLDMNALRIRVHRIRSVVGECTTACLQPRLVY